MFRCHYGACITISKICNGISDCADQSDEPPINSCKIPDYNVNIPAHTTKRYTPYPLVPETTPEKRPSFAPKPEKTTKIYTPYPLITPSKSVPSETTPTPTKTVITTAGTRRYD